MHPDVINGLLILGGVFFGIHLFSKMVQYRNNAVMWRDIAEQANKHIEVLEAEIKRLQEGKP